MPLVSVVINVRNGAPFLREAINSVLAQSFADWELILWDDCSTDDSARVIAEYHDPRFHYYLSPDETPLGEARNRAIAQASGEWLAFLDQDDIWLPGKLEKQLALAAPEVAIIYGRTVLFDSRRGNLHDYDHRHEFCALPEGDLFAELFSKACFINMSSVMLRRSAVQEVGAIPSNIQVVPDYYLYVALARNHKARAVQEVVCRYRVHPGSMSACLEYRRRLHEEPPLIIRKWSPYLKPELVRSRLKRYSTALAVEEIRSGRAAMTGFRRLLSEGSPIWLISRPFAVLWRAIRRKLRRPYWLATEFASDPDCENEGTGGFSRR
jgi:glycosyltransferase involved in cell wall biosynthesis